MWVSLLSSNWMNAIKAIIALFLIVGVISVSSSEFQNVTRIQTWRDNLPQCSVMLVESIPEGLIYPSSAPSHVSTFFAWDMMVSEAQEKVKIASFYWSMLREDVYNSSSAYQGEIIFEKLLKKSQNISVEIVTSGPEVSDNDLTQLTAAGAKVKHLDVAKLLTTGVQHAKLWTVDNQYGYLGSANMDWRSLTQVKELGVFLKDCPIVTGDLAKIIDAFAFVAQGDAQFPIKWEKNYTTIYNRTNPMNVLLNNIPAKVYISMSPPPFTPTGREDDLDTILHIINKAEAFVYVSVMSFLPMIKTYGDKPDEYWPDLTNALVKAAMERNVEVRILVSQWRHTSSKLGQYMKSLRALNGINGARIRVRFFVVPEFTDEQKAIPFSRVNHNKYMVTDKTAYIGTSNWSGDYFKFSGGAAFVVEGEGDREGPYGERPLRCQLEEVFLRDWNFVYTDDL